MSPSKGASGDLFITYTIFIGASAQNVLGNLACASILQTLSITVWYILSASPFSSCIFRTLYSSRIPFVLKCSSNYPWYSTPLFARIAFCFWSVSLSSLIWTSLKTDNPSSLVFNMEAHNFRRQSSTRVTQYYDLACHLVSM